MKAGLFQEQTLRLVMTQELRQALAILQYNAQELTEFLYEQSLENPLIELKSSKGSKQRGTRTVQNQIEVYSTYSITLRQHLLNQLQEQSVNSEDKRILTFLINNIDKNGYLQETDEELMSLLNMPIEKIRKYIEIVQMLEPAGVGARTLQECLILQLKRLQKRSPIAEEILINHFKCFAKKDWRKLSQSLKCKTDELEEAVNLILSLHPKPGIAFDAEKPLYIVPDIVVKKKDNCLTIQLPEGNIPKIEIQEEYSALLRGEAEKEVASYLSEKYEHVQWILRSLQQRRATLLNVMGIIIEKQSEFFQNGPLFLRPLSLKEVAEELGLHESTVSRATRNKYVQTPYGLYEMKYFFSNSVAGIADEGVSSRRVKELIKEFVGAENKRKPLSDQKLAELLQREHDVLVSRRTVAKYREQLKIPASSQRKTIG
ncbi:MAG: RNA polymerase factor sigma-54 [Ectobacillus sp.]